MAPSSLIFVVIIAIWAAYFVQHWVRRRDHLATARSVDRFSESMRVLQNRHPLPDSDLAPPQPRSYAVSPARSSRPQTVVKRAVDRPLRSLATESPAGPSAAGSGHPAGHLTPGRPAPRPSRKVRGLTAVAFLAAFLLVLPLAAFGVASWWLVALTILDTVVAFGWLRTGTHAETAARPSGVSERRRVVPRAIRRESAGSRRRSAARAGVESREVEESHEGAGPFEPVVAAESARSFAPVAERPYDLAASAATEADQPVEAAVAWAAPPVDEDDIPLTWDPVPVPRPTYTMKAKAQHPVPSQAEVTRSSSGDSAAYERDDIRRAAGV